MEETVAVHLPPPVKPGASRRGRRRTPQLPRWPWLVALLVVAVAAGAALLPGATVRITPATVPVGPRSYPVVVGVAGHLADRLQATKTGTATGQQPELVPATGVVTFFNRSIGSVEIPMGTKVSVGGTISFTTTKKITVPGGAFFGDPGKKDVDVVAVEGGTAGNVAAGAIDTIDDPNLRFNRQVTNAQPTSGGLEIPHSLIQQSDIDAVVRAIQADLQQQLNGALTAEPDRLYVAAPATEVPTIDIPADLLGKVDAPTFELSGTLTFDRAYASRGDVEASARSSLLGDASAVPAGNAILEDSIVVDVGPPTAAGDQIQAQASVTGLAAATIDETQVRNLVAGKTVEEARAALADRGEVDVELWPAWLDRLPRLALRISVVTVAPTASASPSP
jgi:baseplate J-like protein